jgi:hypothetical protein
VLGILKAHKVVLPAFRRRAWLRLPDELELVGRRLALGAHEATARQLALEARLALFRVALWANVAIAPTNDVDLLSWLEDPRLAPVVFLAPVVENRRGVMLRWWALAVALALWRRSSSLFWWWWIILSNGQGAQAENEEKGEQVGITHDGRLSNRTGCDYKKGTEKQKD